MKTCTPKKNVPIVIIEDLYNFEELKIIKQEMNNLEHLGLAPDSTGSATSANGLKLKKNTGIYLDAYYDGQRHISNTIAINRRIFSPSIIEKLVEVNVCFSLVKTSTKDSTLFSWYNDGDYYDTHTDSSCFNFITYFIDDSSLFEGGVLSFPDYEISITPKNGQTILMMGSLAHSVSQIKALTDKKTGLRSNMVQAIFHG
jgi:Rps23 Pro-64 3,4-dihydroxylase Tpa1-like proline 4-hydroxylase